MKTTKVTTITSTLLVLALTTVGCSNGDWTLGLFSKDQPTKPAPDIPQPQTRPEQDTTIPEAQAVAVTPAEPAAVAARPWPERIRNYRASAVTHDTIYLEDPFETHGSNDHRFRTWDPDDVLAAVAGPAIFLGRIVALPVNAILDQPWNTHQSHSSYPIEPPAHALPGDPTGMTRLDDQATQDQIAID